VWLQPSGERFLLPCYHPRSVQIEAQPAAFPRPWRTIWFSPRRTIRALLDAEVRPSLVPVVALAALHQALAAILNVMGPDGTVLASRATMPVAVGVLQLVFGVLVGPFILAFTGGWFGGEADPGEIRQSVAWSYAPLAIANIVLVPMLALSAAIRQDGLAGVETGASQLGAALMLLGTVALYFVALGWAIALQVATLAEVQRFSILRAIASLTILAVPLLILSALL
jgi:hypothetical protein